MQINFAEIADMGFSYFLVTLIGVALARGWSGIWPWFKNEYWASRETRWAQQFEATKERERMMMDQSAAFLGAIETFQNGFTQANTAQHLEIIRQLERLGDRLDGLEIQPVALEK